MTFSDRLRTEMAKHLPSEHAITGRMTGHLGGDFIEDLCGGFLESLGAMRTHDFLNQRVMALWDSGAFTDATALVAHLETQWWWRLNKRTKPQVRGLVEDGRPLESKQDDTADLMALDDGVVCLINVKSHDHGRNSRPPNIISANKVLEFFDWVADLPEPARQQTLEQAEVYILSVSWTKEGDHVTLHDSHVKRLTRLHVEGITKVNFDAALQIQWHVRNMVEGEQTPLDFARALAARTATDFENHARKKAEKFQRFIQRLA